MKIAKIMVGNPNDRKGLFVNSLDRVKFLVEQEGNHVDCYIIRYYYGALARFLKFKKNENIFDNYVEIDGILFKNIWLKISFFDYILNAKLNFNVVYAKNLLKKYAYEFSGYDLISCHGIDSIYLGLQVKKIFGTPVISNWHGSDINIIPFRNKFSKRKIYRMLKNSDHNFFVSQRLLKTSEKILPSDNKSVLYTGPSVDFFKLSKSEKLLCRNRLNISTKYVIGYVGNLIEIKNVLVLPEIFYEIQNKISGDISFIVVGDGNLSQQFKILCKEFMIKNVYFLGKQDPEVIPEIMNSLDLLLLPSVNEGLPLVTLEAYKCGVHVVGSNKGGIPEVIGYENAFELDEKFIKNVSERSIFLLENLSCEVVLDDKFSWDAAVKDEKKVHEYVCSKN